MSPATSSLEPRVCEIPSRLVRGDFEDESVQVTFIETDDYAAIAQRPVGARGAVTVRAQSSHAAATALAEITSWFPSADLSPDTIKVDFWQSGQAMFKSTRAIEAPMWDAVQNHHPTDVRSALDQLMSYRSADPAGRVILWHGAPGTGKTSAIRALVCVGRRPLTGTPLKKLGLAGYGL